MSLDALEALRRRFVERTKQERNILAAWQDDGRPMSREVEQIIHNLAGAAGTFGYPELNAAAARIDDRLAQAENPSEPDVRRLLQEIDRLPA